MARPPKGREYPDFPADEWVHVKVELVEIKPFKKYQSEELEDKVQIVMEAVDEELDGAQARIWPRFVLGTAQKPSKLREFAMAIMPDEFDEDEFDTDDLVGREFLMMGSMQDKGGIQRFRPDRYKPLTAKKTKKAKPAPAPVVEDDDEDLEDI